MYGNVADAEADYELVKDLHSEAAKVEEAMERAAKLEQKQIEADLAELERDAAAGVTKLY